MNPDTEFIVTVYLGVVEGAKREDIDMALLFEEEWVITNSTDKKIAM